MNTIKLNFFDTLPSTQTRAKELADAGQTNLCLIANKQTAGYGRNKGAKWESPMGNLYCSFIIEKENFKQPTDLTFLIGATWINLLTQQDVPIQCKWPNDLFIKNKKCGGILVEITNNQLVAGMGINITHSPENLDQPTTKLHDYTAIDKDKLIKDFFKEFENLLNQYKKNGFSILHKIWNAHAYLLNTEVKFKTPKNEIISGIFHGIDEIGAAIIDNQKFISGQFVK